MTEFIRTFLPSLGGFAVLLAALAWIIKSLFSHMLSKDVELYKANLEGQLQLIAKEHEIRFSRLHEKRAEAIEQIYGMLRETVYERMSQS